MEVKVSHHDWRVLRAIARPKGMPVPGRELRLEMSRKTKDGSLLDQLVKDGLLLAVKVSDDPFETKYLLTETGKQAAEYGVLDIDWETIKARDR